MTESKNSVSIWTLALTVLISLIIALIPFTLYNSKQISVIDAKMETHLVYIQKGQNEINANLSELKDSIEEIKTLIILCNKDNPNLIENLKASKK